MYIATWNHRWWIWCHPSHMSCGWIVKVWQAWDTINILWCCATKPQTTQAVGPEDLARTVKQWRHHIYCYIKNQHRTWIVTTHSTWLMSAWERCDKSGTQSIYWDRVHPSHRAPNLWDKIWWELRNNHAITRVVYIFRWRITWHGYVATHSTYIIGTWARSYKPEQIVPFFILLLLLAFVESTARGAEVWMICQRGSDHKPQSIVVRHRCIS